MLIRRRKHRTAELNTTSTADISFMLLIFFLVTTSMDVDKGITRQLPPIDEKQDNSPTDIAKDKIMQIVIAADNSLSVNGEPITAKQIRPRTTTFIRQASNQHLITIEASPSSAYDTYFTLQNELAAAYSEIRNDESRKRFGKSYAKCNSTQRKAINEAWPQRVAEDYDNSEEGGSHD